MWPEQPLSGLPCFTPITMFLICHIFGGPSVFGSFLTTSPLWFAFCLWLLTMPPKPRGKGKRSNGVFVSVSPVKQARKAVQWNHVPVATTRVLEKSLIESEDPVSGQDSVSQKLETRMTMLIDLASRVKATENQVREKTATSPVSLSTIWANRRRAQVWHQPSPPPPRARHVRSSEGEGGKEASTAADDRSHYHWWGIICRGVVAGPIMQVSLKIRDGAYGSQYGGDMATWVCLDSSRKASGIWGASNTTLNARISHYNKEWEGDRQDQDGLPFSWLIGDAELYG